MRFVRLRQASHRSLLLPLVALLLLVGGSFCIAFSFGRVTELRELERAPQPSVEAVVPGELKLDGTAQAITYVTSPYTDTRCIYFSALTEEERTDSDGNTEWVTVDRQSETTPAFRLADETGAIVVRMAGVSPDVERHYRERRGKLRYTEYRLDEGDAVFLFGRGVAGQSGAMEVRFTGDGAFRPILSRTGERGQRASRGLISVLVGWTGLSLAGFGVAFALAWIGRHRVLTLVGAAGAVMAIALITLGVVSMVADLRTGAERITAHEEAARSIITRALADSGVDWPGWTMLGSPEFQQTLGPDERRRIGRIRLDLAASAKRTNDIRDRFPEHIFASLAGVGRFNEPILVEGESLDNPNHTFEPARLGAFAGIGAGVALISALICTIVGLGSLKRKRWVENLHTVPPSGVVMGMAETTGTASFAADASPNTLKDYHGTRKSKKRKAGEADDEDEPRVDPEVGLVSYFGRKPCVAFVYTESERRGTGKNARWVVIKRIERCVNFRVERRDGDAANAGEGGSIVVNPEGSTIYSHRSLSSRSGRIRHAESWLEPGDACYVLGRAGLHERDETHAELRIGAGDKGEPLLIANVRELDVKLRLARVGFAWLSAGLALAIGAGLLGFGLIGGFSMDYYLLAAAVPVLYLLILGIYLLYTNLVFLREQVNRAWANIDVALAKRADLITNIERVTKEAYAHERGVQERLAKLRTLVQDSGDEFGKSVTLLAEAYPDLTSQRLTKGLMDALVLLEDELAYIREGYNEAVRENNQRVGALPELILAKALGFGPREYWGTIQGAVRKRRLPTVELGSND